jgi:hypothetical protein
MCHSIKVHKVVYCHPYVCCYIHPSSLWIRYLKPSPLVKCSPVSVHLRIIYRNISVGLSYTNQHFFRHCLEWILDLFFGSCVKECQQPPSSDAANVDPQSLVSDLPRVGGGSPGIPSLLHRHCRRPLTMPTSTCCRSPALCQERLVSCRRISSLLHRRHLGS